MNYIYEIVLSNYNTTNNLSIFQSVNIKHDSMSKNQNRYSERKLN